MKIEDYDKLRLNKGDPILIRFNNLNDDQGTPIISAGYFVQQFATGGTVEGHSILYKLYPY